MAVSLFVVKKTSEWALEFVETVPPWVSFASNIEKNPSLGERIIEMIQLSTKEIKVIGTHILRTILKTDNKSKKMVLDLSFDCIYDELHLAATRGVKMKFLCYNSKNDEDLNSSLLHLSEMYNDIKLKSFKTPRIFPGLNSESIPINMILIDDEIFYIGSVNTDMECLNKEINIGIVGKNLPKVVVSLNTIFDELWNEMIFDNANVTDIIDDNAFETASEYFPINISTNPDILTKVTKTTSNEKALLYVINTSQKSLYISTGKLNHLSFFSSNRCKKHALSEALIRAATERNVSILILLDAREMKHIDNLYSIIKLISNDKIRAKIFSTDTDDNPTSNAPSMIFQMSVVSSERKAWVSNNSIDYGHFSLNYGIGLNVDSSSADYSKSTKPLIDAINKNFLKYWNSDYASSETLNNEPKISANASHNNRTTTNSTQYYR